MRAVALLLAVIAISYVLLTLLVRFSSRFNWDPFWRGRASLTVMFLMTGSLHFWFGQSMTQMLPDWVPGRLLIIWLSGVCEIAGAIGLQRPAWQRRAGLGLIALLVGVFPSNIYAAYAHIDLGGHGMGPAYLLIRIPLQIFLIWMIYVCAVKRTK